MGLIDVINGILAVDGKLQGGANNLAHKVNDAVGLGNYQISSLFYGTSAALMGYTAGSYIYTEITDPDDLFNPARILVHSLYFALSVHQFMKNRKFEKHEAEMEQGEAIAVDFKFQREKKSLFGFMNAKPHYVGILAAGAIYPSTLFLAYGAGMLLGQYFRDVDHTRPTKKNRVFNFLKNLIPRGAAAPKPSPGYASASASLAAEA